ncbi:hypothetical protein V5O48_019605 [Marasmius crinis-equi]|uniref:Uncharacterized protein n=1 Tax=Marasmius crinis-equi TaxID=585013 RepID=A0ABR3EHZ1_9AGAR
MLRLDGRPVALRADSPSLVYAALVVHALFHVPQMRQKLAKIESLQSGDPLTALVELFVNFELAYLSSLMFDETLLALGAVQSQMTSPPVDWSADFVQNISQLLDERMGYDQ